MDKLQRKVLNHLLDQYEQSKTFLEENKVCQSFSVKITKLFPKYEDDAEYDFFCEINESLKELERWGLVRLTGKKRSGVLEKVFLNKEALTECYEHLQRIPRKTEHQWLEEVWEKAESKFASEDSNLYLPLLRYFSAQREKLAKNQKIEYYDGVHRDYEGLLLLVNAVLENKEEIFIRDFSIRLFQDSKRAEQLKSKAQALLFQYGDFEEKDTVFEECGVVQTPTYVMLKGKGRITLSGQILDLSRMKGDIALSTASFKELEQVEVLGDRVVTVENLTSFHDYSEEGDFVIYLGGFHNKVKREFLCFLYETNKEKEYRHFGDIDAGGFYILEHLKRRTGISFRSLWMDEAVLDRNRHQAKELTQNDQVRLKNLLEMLNEQEKDGELLEDYRGVLRMMLTEGIKLEQEGIML